MGSLSNITPNEFRKLLEYLGCKYVSTKGGHEKWQRPGLTRPIILQTHVKPMPEFIVRNALRTLGISKEEAERILAQL